jgi:hypothetical protein
MLKGCIIRILEPKALFLGYANLSSKDKTNLSFYPIRFFLILFHQISKA